jgi:mono/diheme cytochrome c family protein
MRQISFLSACLLLASVQAGAAADARKGETLAKRWCASCHVVSRDQARATTQAPPFSEIAKSKSFDASKVALFLLAPHPRMPDMNLTRAEAVDLAAYIAGQGK